MLAEGATDEQARRAVVMLDSNGLVFEGRGVIDADKLPFAMSPGDLRSWGFAPAARYDLEIVVSRVAPSVLVGTSGQAGAFTERVIREMAVRVRRPIVMPLSNPTANAEARPADVMAWSEGRAVVATGSPFDPVVVDGEVRVIGQANNVFIFPGVGLGAIVAGSREVTQGMFLVAARTLASMVPADRLVAGAMYPPLTELRAVSRRIAVNVAARACEEDLCPPMAMEEIEEAVEASMWSPGYRWVRPHRSI